MAMARLFSRSRQALMPSLPTLKCNTYASLVLSAKKPKARKLGIPKVIDEEIWNTRREESEINAQSYGSPFLLLKNHISTDSACSNSEEEKLVKYLRDSFIKKNHIFTDSACSNSEGEKLVKHLRDCKDIKYSNEVRSIVLDRRLGQFQRSMTVEEIENYVMRHLYILALQEVIPFEKRYMEHLINKENHIELEQRWRHRNYQLVVRDSSKIFLKLPGRCLRRGFELHMSRIPYKYCLKDRLPKELKNYLLGKLEEEYEILTTKIDEFLPTISKEMMTCEIKSLVDHVPGAFNFGKCHDRFFYELIEDQW